MDQELIDEIEEVFAEIEQTEYLSSHDDHLDIYAADAQAGDFITVLGDEYYIEHVVVGNNMLLCCHRVESVEKIVLAVGREVIIHIRRVQ